MTDGEAARTWEARAQDRPRNERVVIDDFDRDVQVTLAFPSGPTITGNPRADEFLTAMRWGRKWRTEGRLRFREVEWRYQGRVPGRFVVHLEPEAQWRVKCAGGRAGRAYR